MPALIRAIRRVHASGIESEVVTARDGRAIMTRSGAPRRPIVPVDASVPISRATNAG